MTWSERMQVLLAGLSETEGEALSGELIDLELQLTIAELLLLLKAAVQDGTWLWEPLAGLCVEEDLKTPRLLSAAVSLPEYTLRALAGQARMVRLGLLTTEQKPDGWEYVLTPKGAHAVVWWAEELAGELGFGLPMELTQPISTSTSAPSP